MHERDLAEQAIACCDRLLTVLEKETPSVEVARVVLALSLGRLSGLSLPQQQAFQELLRLAEGAYDESRKELTTVLRVPRRGSQWAH
jgi:hypothetical protein